VSFTHAPSSGVCPDGHVDSTPLAFITLPPVVIPKSSHWMGMSSVATRVVGTVVIVWRSMRTVLPW